MMSKSQVRRAFAQRVAAANGWRESPALWDRPVPWEGMSASDNQTFAAGTPKCEDTGELRGRSATQGLMVHTTVKVRLYLYIRHNEPDVSLDEAQALSEAVQSRLTLPDSTDPDAPWPGDMQPKWLDTVEEARGDFLVVTQTWRVRHLHPV